MELFKKYFFRLSLLVGIFVAFIYYISKNLPIIIHTFDVTISQSLIYLLLTLVLSLLAYFFLVLMNKKVFGMLGIQRKTSEMFNLLTSALAINVLVPTGGFSAGIMFTQDAKRRGESGAVVISALTLALLANYTSIVVLLIFAIVYLTAINALGLHVIIPAIIFLLITFGLFLLIYLAGKNKTFLNKFLSLLIRSWQKCLSVFHKKRKSDKNTAENFANELAKVYNTIVSDPRDLYVAAGYIFLSHFFYLASLYVLFMSLGLFPLYRIIISGYVIGLMFVVISPTPNGVGFVEGSMVLAYTSLGLPGAAAATVALIYRGFSFWLPLMFGFIVLQKNHLLRLMEGSK